MVEKTDPRSRTKGFPVRHCLLSNNSFKTREPSAALSESCSSSLSSLTAAGLKRVAVEEDVNEGSHGFFR
jgi:hypothetical protein